MTENSFSQARQKKRQLFIASWNVFLRSVSVRVGLSLFSLSVLLTACCFGSFLRNQCLEAGLLMPGYPSWMNGILLAVQVLTALPGCLTAAGLWMLYRRGLWQEQVDTAGLKLLRQVNTGICIVTGIAVFLYPTVIIGVGEYLPESGIFFVFYIFLSATLLLMVCVGPVRVVLRCAEENMACCWANTRYLLPLLLTMLSAAAAVVIWLPMQEPFVPALLLLIASGMLLLALYYRAMAKISTFQQKIDADTVRAKQGPYDDPYTRY